VLVSSVFASSAYSRFVPFYPLQVLQGGNFDLADRLFSSIPQAWESASKENRGDVRELIGSFFCGNGEFLINENHHDFGFKQGGGLVDDVELPKWARDDPLLFVTKHRAVSLRRLSLLALFSVSNADSFPSSLLAGSRVHLRLNSPPSLDRPHLRLPAAGSEAPERLPSSLLRRSHRPRQDQRSQRASSHRR